MIVSFLFLLNFHVFVSLEWKSYIMFLQGLWTPSHVRAKGGPPAQTYLQQQLCTDIGWNIEDLPGAIDDRDEWRERVREIHASCTIRWWGRWTVLSSTPFNYFYRAKTFLINFLDVLFIGLLLIISSYRLRYQRINTLLRPLHNDILTQRSFTPKRYITQIINNATSY